MAATQDSERMREAVDLARQGEGRTRPNPPVGAVLCHGNVAPVKEIVDPLSARGVVLFAGHQPVAAHRGQVFVEHWFARRFVVVEVVDRPT